MLRDGDRPLSAHWSQRSNLRQTREVSDFQRLRMAQESITDLRLSEQNGILAVNNA